MSDKVYPKQLPRKRDESRGAWAQQYRGAVSALLTQEEVEFVKSVFEELYGRDDISEDLGDELERLQDVLIGIAQNGESRMENLHGVLGAFDLGPGGEVSKPESERIKWQGQRLFPKPDLTLVKGNTDQGRED